MAVELRLGVRPAIAIGRDQVTAVVGLSVIKVVVGVFNYVL